MERKNQIMKNEKKEEKGGKEKQEEEEDGEKKDGEGRKECRASRWQRRQGERIMESERKRKKKRKKRGKRCGEPKKRAKGPQKFICGQANEMKKRERRQKLAIHRHLEDGCTLPCYLSKS